MAAHCRRFLVPGAAHDILAVFSSHSRRSTLLGGLVIDA